MSPDEPTPSERDYLSQIWSVSTTLTEEAMAAALKKCLELGFDPDRGIVPLRETFINLSSARTVLEDAIEKEKLIQLPISVQKEILLNLQSVSKSMQGLISGTDEVVNLANSVEALNTSIWKYGLHNLSEQVLGYQKKLNQLKNLEVQLSNSIAQLDTAKKAAEKANLAANEIEQRRTDIQATLEQVKQVGTESASSLQQIREAGTQAATFYSTIQQQEKLGAELTSNIKTSSNELTSLDGSIRKFYGDVEEYRDKINKTSEEAAELMRTSAAAFQKLTEETVAKVDAAVEAAQLNGDKIHQELSRSVEAMSSETQTRLTTMTDSVQANLTVSQKALETKLQETLTEVASNSSKLVSDVEAKVQTLETQLNERSDGTIGANQRETQSLIAELRKLEDKIREQIQQATGFTLFGAFQSRQNQIAGSKKLWATAIFVLVVISAGVTAWIAYESKEYKVSDVALWIKLSLTIPLGFAITFCTVQYSRERRLEEEYAFKSSISVSLNPYRDLIHSMLEKDGAIDQARYTQFVIDSVTNVFTPPTDRVFETLKKRPGVTVKMLKQTAEIIGTAAKAAK